MASVGRAGSCPPEYYGTRDNSVTFEEDANGLYSVKISRLGGKDHVFNKIRLLIDENLAHSLPEEMAEGQFVVYLSNNEREEKTAYVAFQKQGELKFEELSLHSNDIYKNLDKEVLIFPEKVGAPSNQSPADLKLGEVAFYYTDSKRESAALSYRNPKSEEQITIAPIEVFEDSTDAEVFKTNSFSKLKGNGFELFYLSSTGELRCLFLEDGEPADEIVPGSDLGHLFANSQSRLT
ncbi:MAG: hypothetical protein S4CHLAM45_13880 [Chlamydiales bacterium]|nr:hypothetical protein [Chlamydiales bacterium]MCH9620493.1 hypothetical protein [Chlamydiales bacterium]MCH9623478.1 hypothetical protein [Chlamydiales bacterium]